MINTDDAPMKRKLGMPSKDYAPIRFEFMQSDMEKLMYQIDMVLHGKTDERQWHNIRFDIQHKIEYHRTRGDWK